MIGTPKVHAHSYPYRSNQQQSTGWALNSLVKLLKSLCRYIFRLFWPIIINISVRVHFLSRGVSKMNFWSEMLPLITARIDTLDTCYSLRFEPVFLL